METSDGVANMTEEIRQAAARKHPFLMNTSATPKSKGGASFASIFRTKKRPQKSEPQQLGFAALGPFSGPENGPHFGAAAEMR